MDALSLLLMCRLQLWMTINSCTKRSVIYSLSVLQPYYFFLYCKCAHFCNVNKSLFNEYIWECLCCQDAKWIYSEYLEIHLVSKIFWHRTTIICLDYSEQQLFFTMRLTLSIKKIEFLLSFTHSIVPNPYDFLSSMEHKKWNLKTILFHGITMNRDWCVQASKRTQKRHKSSP